MRVLTLGEVANAIGGTTANPDVPFNGVFTDTRQAMPGGLFVALVGEYRDGHTYVKSLKELNAAAAVVRKGFVCDIPTIEVDDTSKALLELAAYYRSLFNIPVIAITGSAGKTTTKDMIACVCSAKYKTIKTNGNLNNRIGMPLTIFNIDDDTEVAVIEMGMNHFGELSELTNAAKPTMAVISNIGTAHIENLGSREGILTAKLEITEGLKKGSPLILNYDNDLLAGVTNDDLAVTGFGMASDKAEITASDYRDTDEGVYFTVSAYGEKEDFFVPYTGIFNVYNALSAVAVGHYIGISLRECADALKSFVASGLRQKTVNHDGITVILDCYNSNPEALRGALGVLVNKKGLRKICVLGDMKELGKYSEVNHRQIGATIGAMDIDVLFTYGSEMAFAAEEAKRAGMKEVYTFSADERIGLAEKLKEVLRSGDTVLFKASNSMRLIEVYKDTFGASAEV